MRSVNVLHEHVGLRRCGQGVVTVPVGDRSQTTNSLRTALEEASVIASCQAKNLHRIVA